MSVKVYELAVRVMLRPRVFEVDPVEVDSVPGVVDLPHTWFVLTATGQVRRKRFRGGELRKRQQFAAETETRDSSPVHHPAWAIMDPKPAHAFAQALAHYSLLCKSYFFLAP